MANIHLRLKQKSGGYSAEVDVLDDPGPFNTWKSRKAGVWSIDNGTFTNQNNVGNARGCGSADCWTLKTFDIDKVKPNDGGEGLNNDAGGTFPVGPITWVVLG